MQNAQFDLSAFDSGAETSVAVVCKQLLFAVIAIYGNDICGKKRVIADLEHIAELTLENDLAGGNDLRRYCLCVGKLYAKLGCLIRASARAAAALQRRVLELLVNDAYRKLAALADARGRFEWEQTASLMALIVNLMRDPKKNKAVKAEDFNPYTVKEKAFLKAPLSVLRDVFVKK